MALPPAVLLPAVPAFLAASALAAAPKASAQPKVLPCERVSGAVVPWGGILVRAQPSGRARVTGRIPRAGTGTVVAVTGTSGGWLRVGAVRSGRGRTLYRGGGWIYGGRLMTHLRLAGGKGLALRERPNAKAPVLARLRGQGTGVLLECSGAWTRLRVGRVIGWVAPANRCANPLRACR
jgi:hypothetical protein